MREALTAMSRYSDQANIGPKWFWLSRQMVTFLTFRTVIKARTCSLMGKRGLTAFGHRPARPRCNPESEFSFRTRGPLGKRGLTALGIAPRVLAATLNWNPASERAARWASVATPN